MATTDEERDQPQYEGTCLDDTLPEDVDEDIEILNEWIESLVAQNIHEEKDAQTDEETRRVEQRWRIVAALHRSIEALGIHSLEQAEQIEAIELCFHDDEACYCNQITEEVEEE